VLTRGGPPTWFCADVGTPGPRKSKLRYLPVRIPSVAGSRQLCEIAPMLSGAIGNRPSAHDAPLP
jgi:hypothetical protein